VKSNDYSALKFELLKIRGEGWNNGWMDGMVE
jgi:hypothetical protein